MNLSHRIFRLIATIVLLVCPTAIYSQWDKKPYSEWSDKEALKLLNDSPWCQTQTFTDSSRASSTSRGSTVISDIVNVNFRIRFLSAKPVRQAISRYMEIQQKDKMSEQMVARLKSFATGEFPDYIIITVTVDADKLSNMQHDAEAVLHKVTTSLIKNNTYLLTDTGQRIFLQEYRPPRNDGLGANFVFPRIVDGKPFITPDTKEVVFHTELTGASTGNTASRDFTLDMRYKVKNMNFGGKLEY